MRRPLRCLGYARVSSVDQAVGTSLEDQQNVIRAYAKTRGVEVAKMYVESESAVHEKFERREQIQQLMASVRAGDLVVVDKIDRWSRDPEFTYSSIRKILAEGASFYAVGDGVDPSTHDGDSMLNMRVLFAREEHKRIKQRLVGTRRLLRDRGLYVEGLPPFGYERQQVRGIDRNVLVINEEKAEIVREIFRMCIAGRSMSETAAMLDVKRDLVRDALHNRVYLGEVRDSSGNWIAGKHPAIISKHTFVGAENAIDRRRLSERKPLDSPRTSTWWMRNISRCGFCKAKMSSAYARYDYYRCYKKCTSSYVRVDVVEDQAIDIVAARLIDLREELSRAPDAPKPVAKVDVTSKLAALEAKRVRLADSYADGVITRDQMRDRVAKLDADRTRLEALRDEAPPVTKVQRRATLAVVERLVDLWRRSQPTDRREIVRGLAKAAYLIHGHAPRFDWYSAEDLVRRG